jgi:hypothetical protein
MISIIASDLNAFHYYERPCFVAASLELWFVADGRSSQPLRDNEVYAGRDAV